MVAFCLSYLPVPRIRHINRVNESIYKVIQASLKWPFVLFFQSEIILLKCCYSVKCF